MSTRYRIRVWDGKGWFVDDDYAPNEEEARQQASGWTGQRGQMKWKATIYDPDGKAIATYKRGAEVKQ